MLDEFTKVPAEFPPEIDAYLEIPFPKRISLMGPLSRQQIIHISAPRGLGKTQLALGLGDALTAGEDFLKWSVPEPVGVLLVDGEMPGGDLQERLRQYKPRGERATFRIANAVNWAASQGYEHPNLAQPEWQDRILKWAEGCEVIILDNVMALLDVPGASMSSDEFWRPAFTFGLRARAAGYTCIWFDHTNSLGLTFGTRVKEWSCDLVMNLAPIEGHDQNLGAAFTVTFTKVRAQWNTETDPFDVYLQTGADGYFKWDWKPAQTLKEQIGDLMECGFSQRKIAKEMGISLGTVNKIVKEIRSRS